MRAVCASGAAGRGGTPESFRPRGGASARTVFVSVFPLFRGACQRGLRSALPRRSRGMRSTRQCSERDEAEIERGGVPLLCGEETASRRKVMCFRPDNDKRSMPRERHARALCGAAGQDCGVASISSMLRAVPAAPPSRGASHSRNRSRTSFLSLVEAACSSMMSMTSFG